MTHDPRTEDLGFARVDLDRAARTGDAEVVYGEGKTPEQIVSILTTLHSHHPDRAVLATRAVCKTAKPHWSAAGLISATAAQWRKNLGSRG